jgi:hypothetical protein
MPHLFSRAFSGVTLALTLFTMPALATVENALDPIPKDAAIVATIQTEFEPWAYFIGRFMNVKTKMDGFTELLAEAKKKGFDLPNDLLSVLGSHLTVAVYTDESAKSEDFQVLLSIDTSSPSQSQALIDKLQALQGPEIVVQTEKLGEQTLYLFSEKKQKSSSPLLLSLALSGNNLLLSMAKDTSLLKRALSAQGSRSGNVLAQAAFHNVFKRYKDEPAWFWFDKKVNQKFNQLVNALSEETGLEHSALDQLWAGTGFSFKPTSKGLSMQFFTPLAQDIPAEWREFYKHWSKPANYSLNKLLGPLPDSPLLVMGGNKLNLYAQGFSPNGDSKASQEMRSIYKTLEQTFAELLPKADLGLDLQKDVLPHLDGRYAFWLGTNAKGMPQGLAYWGVLPESRDSFGNLVRTKLKLDPAIFTDLLGEKTRSSDTQGNMHVLQTIVETYGVDWGGLYPESLERLEKEATHASYWKGFVNPINQAQGRGLKKALLDYKTYKNFKPHANFAGMVFYEPGGTTSFDKDCKCKHYSGYRIYGYLPNGELWVQEGGSLDKGLPLHVFAKNLPAVPSKLQTTLQFEPKPVVYKNQNIYLFQRPASVKSPTVEEFQPGCVQLGDFWVLGSNQAVLRQAIDQGVSDSAQASLAQKPVYKEQMGKLKNPESDFLVYFDAERLRKLLNVIAEDDPEMSEIQAILAPFQGLMMQFNQDEDGTVGQIEIPIEMDKVDFEAAVKVFSEMGLNTGSEKAKVSSVKANMHTLQVLVETYGVDWGGTYPIDLDTLFQQAQKYEYWKDVRNPFTDQKGIGLRGALMAYKDYVPSPDFAGMVLYKPAEGKNPNGYWIYGVDQKGELIKDNEQVFVLSNF